MILDVLDQAQPILVKMSGAGNDFLILDLRNKSLSSIDSGSLLGLDRRQMAQKLCLRVASLSADGLLFLEPDDVEGPESCDVKWDFYNADGSAAEMCGNAARCVVKYLWRERGDFLTDESQVPIRLRTLSGVVSGTVSPTGEVAVEMRKIVNPEWSRSIHILDEDHTYDFIDSGVPHAVLEVEDMASLDSLVVLARAIQNSPIFQPKATNVTFYKINGAGKIQSASFERGIEGFTLACGTGVVAASLSYMHKVKKMTVNIKSNVEVSVPGGKLSVQWNGFSPVLMGEAKFICDIKVYNHRL